MSIIYLLLVIIAILAFIAYQLYQSNQLKKRVLENRELEKEEKQIEERITAFMPHLYNKATLEDKLEMKRFLDETDEYNKQCRKKPFVAVTNPYSYPPCDRPFEFMENMTMDESNIEKKEEMQKALERMKITFNELDQQLFKREITDTEREYVKWCYYGNEYDNFPTRDKSSYYDIISVYVKMFPEKK